MHMEGWMQGGISLLWFFFYDFKTIPRISGDKSSSEENINGLIIVFNCASKIRLGTSNINQDFLHTGFSVEILHHSSKMTIFWPQKIFRKFCSN